jgi:hypothetical protein
MTGGDGDCVKQLTEEEENEREKKSDEEDDELIRKLQRQGQDFINRNKPK